MTTMLAKMAEVIEAKVRAAGAIYDYDGTDIARAALQAIREPTDSVLYEVFNYPISIEGVKGSADFTAMIDAILEEKTT